MVDPVIWEVPCLLQDSFLGGFHLSYCGSVALDLGGYNFIFCESFVDVV